ncbi:MAG: glycosyltransferase [Verrucomicrobia bacterium]|nr:glycosyltransferase [Verrucomicrobiota bacterium]
MFSVTVVIPTYNRRLTLTRCLDSVLAQTKLPVEIVVVDDGSTDGTAAWLRNSYPQVTLIEQKNQGVSSARNMGIRKATTDWIAFLDSDDCWLPEKLEKQAQALSENPEYQICHTEEKWIFKGKDRPVADLYRKKGGWVFKDCLPVCAISPSTVLIHREVFETVGLFDETLPVCEDYDLWLRICSRLPVLLVDEALIQKHGGHEDQLSAQRGLDKYRIQALRKILKGDQLSDENRKLAEVQLREKCDIYAKGLEKHGNLSEAEKYRLLAEKR